MKRELVRTKILQKKEVAPHIFEYIIDADNALQNSKAGQFIHVKCGDGVYLRRPISICEIFEKKLRFLFEVKGEGTRELAEKAVGDFLDVLGPLGIGFTTNQAYQNPVVIGGGIGIYPLLQVAKEVNPIAILGFRNQSLVTLEEDFQKVCQKVIVTTDDGSYGKKGLVTDRLREILEEKTADAIFVCGPMPMIRAVREIALEHQIFCEVSLEERMACGIGACLCCATKVKSPMAGEEYTYFHVCKAGPVFNAKEVMLDD